MQDEPTTPAQQARETLIEAGGRLAQDFGFSRTAGQVLMSLYLNEGPAPLEEIEEALGLSKAAVSMACTRLEALGLIARVRNRGDRRRFYRSADNLYQAVSVGIAGFVNAELTKLDHEVAAARTTLAAAGADDRFLRARIERLGKLSGRMTSVLSSPAVRLLAGLAK
ncbi:MAG: MarR family transcriptional regulator [Lentisphaerae bacterium]|jgi:DNA-binding transcriptional regulator GbsR (MarR family)|nr:MarR family transcriptional regulator [Lentisphaerota bacterium]